MADGDDEQATHRVLQSLGDSQSATVWLVANARHSVDLFTRDLEPAVYGREVFTDAVRSFLVSSPRARLRVLVRNGLEAVQGGNMLIELVRRLTDRAEIRRVPREHRDRNDTFLLVDRGGVLYRPMASAYEGIADSYDPLRARDLRAIFNNIWEQAERDPEMRRLYI